MSDANPPTRTPRSGTRKPPILASAPPVSRELAAAREKAAGELAALVQLAELDAFLLEREHGRRPSVDEEALRERQRLGARLSPEIRVAYDRALRAGRRPAVVRLVASVCSGCHVRLHSTLEHKIQGAAASAPALTACGSSTTLRGSTRLIQGDGACDAMPMKPRAHDPTTANLLQRALAQAGEGRRRRNAARALGHLGPLARHTVYDLAASALDDPDPDVRRECVHSLARLGAVATSAIPHLTAALRDPSPWVRAEAAVTLTAIWNAMVEGVLGRR